ncbi:keratin-associated protein 10-7 [Harpegnathos saltator]|uniref:IGFBP N-terminal domain-containing protein n=1 Tax=Harpegnathos saltator TaxID=610380 RepID=E2BWB5_HARSA|nr:keratin-associated protein 10-7 [Harpegnathos saltator]EFN80019.1 hypothetical protein EAI_10718 [Harpegnathos saltator]
MPCDGKTPNCERRRELLTQLKCLISSMDRRKPCEWDEPSAAPIVKCCVKPIDPYAPCNPCDPCVPCCIPVKRCKSYELRASIMYKCECIKRNGLQDRCMMWDCMGRPECMTKLYPVCGPGRTALLKLTDLGDAEVALKKFYCADKAREAALAAYCRLICNNGNQVQSPMSVARCNDNNGNNGDSCQKPACCDEPLSLRQVYVPSPADTCYIPQICYTCSPPPCPPPSSPTCVPFCPPPVCQPCVPCCPVF